MTNFSPAQVNTITFLTMGVFNNDRHHDVMESMVVVKMVWLKPCSLTALY